MGLPGRHLLRALELAGVADSSDCSAMLRGAPIQCTAARPQQQQSFVLCMKSCVHARNGTLPVCMGLFLLTQVRVAEVAFHDRVYVCAHYRSHAERRTVPAGDGGGRHGAGAAA